MEIWKCHLFHALEHTVDLVNIWADPRLKAKLNQQRTIRKCTNDLQFANILYM